MRVITGQKFVLTFKRTRSSNISSVNEQNFGTSVKVANENSLSTDDKWIIFEITLKSDLKITLFENFSKHPGWVGFH